MRNIFIILAFIFQNVLIYGQNLESKLFQIHSIQTERIGKIYELAEDNSGFLWLATNKGLYTFDGNKLLKFDKTNSYLKNAFYTSLFIDSKNRIWAGTLSKGLICINDSRDSIVYYHHIPNDNFSIRDDRVNLIFEDYKNNIWVATHTSGISKFNNKTAKFVNYSPSKIFIERDKRNIDEFISHNRDDHRKNIEWIGTLDGLIQLNVDSKKFRLYYCDINIIVDKKNLNGLENQIRNINFIHGGLMLGTWGGGICKLDTVNNIWESYKFESPFPKAHTRNNVLFAKVNKNRKYILSLFGKGTQEYNPKTNALTHLSNKYLSTYFIDSKNQEWYVLNKNKLFVNTQKSNIFKSIPVHKQITAFYFDKSKNLLYTGVYNKPQIIIIDLVSENSKIINYKPIHDNAKNWISGIFKDSHGRLIIHENRDLYLLKNDKIIPFINLESLNTKQNFYNKSTLSSFVDRDDNIWLGYKESGVLRVKTKTKEHFVYDEKDGLQHSSWISVFFEDKQGRIWIGTEKSLSFFSKNDSKFYNIIDSSRSFNFIFSILQDSKNNLWVGEGYNILKVNIDSDNKYNLRTINPPETIGNDINIYRIDSLDNLWGSSSKGIFYYNTEKNTFRLWGSIYDFKEIIDIDFQDKDTMFVVMYNGISKGNRQDLFNASQNAKLDFTNLKLFNKDYKYKNKHISELNEISLDHKQNFLTIEFSLKEIISPEELYFEYKLEGFRDEWIPLGNRNFIEFSHLNPGQYKLQVRQSTVGQEPVYSKKLKITILPPFWKTWWFMLLVIITIALAIYIYIERRNRKMKLAFEKEVEFQKKLANVEMMALKSQMNPHFVFNCLNTIKLFVIENETEKASRYISDFAKLLRIALNESRLDLTTIYGELESIRLYIELEKMRFAQKFDYVISFPKDMDPKLYKVPPMLLQPFVENAILHGILPSSKTGKLTIDVKKSEGYIIFTILDNGIGRKASQAYKNGDQLNPSLGINITNDRLKLFKTIYGMEASVNIFDLEYNGIAQGTKVVVKIPIIIEAVE